MSLILKNVSKSFVGKKAVDNVSFSLEKPGVYGLLGTNGAGKTTTIRMLLGIIKKDSGEITWKGKTVDRKNVKFGYLPEERGVYPKTKIFDQLMYFAELKGMKKEEAANSINKWAKELKVEEYLQMPAEKLSKGNQQKIQFMTAIIHDPELVVLDEPFSGLDPVNTEILKNIIIDLIKNGKYIIMSAHQMATIEEFCSDILILNKGKTVLQGNLKEIKETYPAGKELRQEPDIVIFNNDFVLLKVLTNDDGRKTVAHLSNPPLQVRTGLLPQDMLVPSGLIIPENIKGIIGNLKIDTKREDIIRVENKDSYEDFLIETEPDIAQNIIQQLKNKILFVTTNYSKNIQVVEPAKAVPSYSLAQKSIPVDVKAVDNGKFLLVTTYDRPFLDVISVADSRFIKQINLPSNPEEIFLDEAHAKAYVTSPTASSIFVIDLRTMSLSQKIKINGYCEKLLLKQDKLFYVDKLKNEIWAIELCNNYELKNIGMFPNVSALAFNNNKIYITSRTKSRIAIVDYSTLGLVNEFTTVNKPISMYQYDKFVYVLGAQNNEIQKINTDNDQILGIISLGTSGFSRGISQIDDSSLAVITDLKNNQYTIFDLAKGKVLKTYKLNVPIKSVVIANKVNLFD